jgi:hypothetical protein
MIPPVAISVFICYRHEDTTHLADRLRERLAAAPGAGPVFLDRWSLPPGKPFPEEIRGQVVDADVVLTLVGKRWEPARLWDPSDFVRLEISLAIAEGVPVLPLLADGAKMPESSELPDELGRFARLNAMELRSGRDFDNDVTRLMDAISALAAGRSRAVGGSDGSTAGTQRNLLSSLLDAIVSRKSSSAAPSDLESLDYEIEYKRRIIAVSAAKMDTMKFVSEAHKTQLQLLQEEYRDLLARRRRLTGGPPGEDWTSR